MAITVAAQPAADQNVGARPIRVMIVDDAVVVRGLLSRWLREAGGIEVASTHRTGAEAVAAVERVRPDIVLLDIEMPDMDGITALPLLLKKLPTLTVIVASTLTARNADISLRCLALGAVDYVAKPSTNRDVTFSVDFRREIVDKVRALGASRGAARSSGARWSQARREPTSPAGKPLVLRPLAKAAPRLLVIGASTGGPNAVAALLKNCGPAIDTLPVIVVQHMPAMFTAMFADHLKRHLGVEACEARCGDRIERGRVYVAPGGRHLRFVRDGGAVQAVVDDAPPVNFCRPSVDVTLASASRIYGGRALAAVLTGMGTDGLAGAAAVVAAGGNVVAQDEASSVVWGMPGAVAKHGLCAVVGPLEALARIINESVRLPA